MSPFHPYYRSTRAHNESYCRVRGYKSLKTWLSLGEFSGSFVEWAKGGGERLARKGKKETAHFSAVALVECCSHVELKN